MSDTKQTKPKKSKTRKIQVKSHQSASANNVVPNNFSLSSTNVPYHQLGGIPIPQTSILGDMDMDHLKQATFKNIKSSLGSPSARDDCINYALEMVISNLIINGRLDPAKAQNMRTPLMKAQIASICDKMLKKRVKKSPGSGKSPANSVKKSKSAPTRPKQKVQKWALQPAALPITIVTDQVNPNAPGFITNSNYSFKSVGKQGSAGSFKSIGEISTEHLRTSPKKKKVKSVEPPSLGSNPLTTQPLHQTQLPKQRVDKRNNQSSQQGVIAVASSQSTDSGSRSSYQDTSSVPSFHSVDFHSNESNSKTRLVAGAETARAPVKAPSKTVVVQESTSLKVDVEKVTPVYHKIDEVENASDNQGKGDKISLPLSLPTEPFTADSRCQSAGAESNQSSTKTLNDLIASSSTVCSANSNGFQILVDMKGFNNDEISMEVEGRCLIFLASRPKRNDLNIRKVTEIVDVPTGVNMENLKIGRRVDGFVIVEEFEAESETS